MNRGRISKKKKTHLLSPFLKIIFSPFAFTLVELLVVIAMLSVLITLLILLVNPLAQLSKAKDAQRKHDLLEVKNALDSYYNDTNCYPQNPPATTDYRIYNSSNNTIVDWGKSWLPLMQKLPKDPDSPSDANWSYKYVTDGSSCPQWNVLFARKGFATVSSDCVLTQIPNCFPASIATNANTTICAVSGQVNCSYITSLNISYPTNSPTGATPTNTRAPTSTATPRPSATNTSTPTSTPTNTSTPTLTPTRTGSETPTPTNWCLRPLYKCTENGTVCNNVGEGNGTYCGFSGCVGNSCCNYQCSGG